MMDLFRQFFSFEKMMKDRLVTAFFFLGLVVVVLSFLSTIGAGFSRMGHDFISGFGLLLFAFFQILLLFVGLRLACELMIAVFHINDNLSPDGGKSDTAALDPLEAAREAASKAAKSATSVTRNVVEKTKSRFADDDDEPVGDVYPDYEDPTPPKRVRKKPATKKPAAKKTTTTKTTAAKKPAAKKAPAKKTTSKTTTRKTTKK
jgi:hypothetical protein